MPPTALQLEVTENIVMADPVRAIQVLEATAGARRPALARRLRHRLLLARLPQAPATRRAEDRPLLRAGEWLTTTPTSVIVRSTIELAQRLGLQVVAEGVEDRRHLAAAGRDRLRGGPGLLPGPAASGRRLHRLADRPQGAGRGHGYRLSVSFLFTAPVWPRASATLASASTETARRSWRSRLAAVLFSLTVTVALPSSPWRLTEPMRRFDR